MGRSKERKGVSSKHSGFPICRSSRSSDLPFFRSSIEAVFFDAAGTLFETRRSVGAIYADALETFGIRSSPDELERRFKERFPLQPPLAFDPALDDSSRLELEMDWWRTLVAEVVAPEGAFPGFDEFFTTLFDYFRGDLAWRLFDDTRPALEMLRTNGFKLGVISNFDSRLESILDSLDLTDYFDTVRISSRTGYAKPDPRSFTTAAKALGMDPAHCLHVGDRRREDFEGPMAAGMRAVWLNRLQ